MVDPLSYSSFQPVVSNGIPKTVVYDILSVVIGFFVFVLFVVFLGVWCLFVVFFFFFYHSLRNNLIRYCIYCDRSHVHRTCLMCI